MARRVGKKKDSIEGMKDMLYSRQLQPEMHPENRTPLEPEGDAHTAVAWDDGRIKPTTQKTNIDYSSDTVMNAKRAKRISFATKFFIGSLVFFLIAAGVAAYLFFVGTNTISPQNIDIQVVSPSIIDGGKTTTFEIIINNRNQSPLQLADLSIDYPDNTRNANDQSVALKHERQSIGSINPGEQVKRTISAVFYGQEGSPQKVVATLQYSIPNSNSIFQKQAEADFIIGSSPVSVTVDSPQEAISDQQFSMDVSITSNSAAAIDNLVLEGVYPFGYTLSSATPAVEASGNFWRLGTLNPGETKKVHLDGKIIGQDGDQRVFKFLTGSDADQTNTTVKVPFIIVPQTLTVHKPFITASLALGGKTSATVPIQAGDTVNGVINWKNNLTVPVSNMEVVLSLTGPVFDAASVNSTNGFFQSLNNTITWTKDQDSTLANVAPGGSGTLSFSFATKGPGSGGIVYTNPTINLAVTVSGVREGQAGVPESISSAATIQGVVASAVELSETALHFSGPFSNTGPMPPRAEQRTTYTVVWTMRNSSNTIANGAVSAVLPAYVTYVAAVDPSVTFDAASRTVTWGIGDLKAGVGYSSAQRTSSFQVSLLPSSSQVGQVPDLTGPPKFSGQDRFAQVTVETAAPAANIALTNDTGFQSSMGTVQAK